uniref:Myb/SANT DNA binding domain containing 5 family member 5 n=1 Tax=Mus musculus TaxID=10090 RepID=F2Z3W5_MOUSE
MQREDNRVQSVRNDKEANRRRRLRQEGQSSSGPCDSPWTEDEIWILLQEWAMVEYELGDPGNKMHAKAKSLSRRLSNRGLRKSKNSCLDVMVKMKDLHTRLCNERPRAYRLYSTYEWILYEILGHPRSQGGYVPGPWFDGHGNPPASYAPSLCIDGAISLGPSFSPWTDPEIKIFLQEWQVVEREFGHPGQKIKQKSSLVCQRLYHRGLFKDIQSCLDLMWTMKDLHSTLSRERSRTVPLFSPYRDYLERIFDPKCQRGHVPGVQYNWSGYHRPSSNPQTPMVMPSPVYQPWDYGMAASSGQLPWIPLLIMSSQDLLVPRWDAWNATYPLPVQHVFQASLPGDNNFQLPWSPRDESSSPQ